MLIKERETNGEESAFFLFSKKKKKKSSRVETKTFSTLNHVSQTEGRVHLTFDLSTVLKRVKGSLLKRLHLLLPVSVFIPVVTSLYEP